MRKFLYILALSFATTLPAQDEVKETRKQEQDPEEVREEKAKVMKEQMQKLEAEAEKGNRAAILEVGNNYFYGRSEEHTSELQSQFRISYAVFCLKKKKQTKKKKNTTKKKKKITKISQRCHTR